MSGEQAAGDSLERLMQVMFSPPALKEADKVEGIFDPQVAFDAVEFPSHYALFGGQLEVIELIEDRLTTEEFAGYLKGNMIKYLMRADKKNGIQDYSKLSKYVRMYLEEDEKNG